MNAAISPNSANRYSHDFSKSVIVQRLTLLRTLGRAVKAGVTAPLQTVLLENYKIVASVIGRTRAMRMFC